MKWLDSSLSVFKLETQKQPYSAYILLFLMITLRFFNNYIN